jgi:O-acetyl-ADP-ribose deacetylase (regulator of RNase III)
VWSPSAEDREDPALPRDDIRIVLGDLTQQRVDAIVNPASSTLLGGGVGAAIHRAAGPQLLEECRTLGGCEAGEAKITRGYQLPARWVIHTVGPVWRGGGHGEHDLLAKCYRSSLALAARPEFGIRTIAFPSIGTGADGYPIDQAALIAVDEVDRFQATRPPFHTIFFVCFSQESLEAYRWAAREIQE